MFSMKRILAPVDFSERSVGAVRYMQALAEHFAAESTLLHVLPPPHYEFSSMEVGGTVIADLFEARMKQVREDLDSFLVEEFPGLRAGRVLLEGDPARKIVEYAQDSHTDLIVVPTHGHGPFRRFILGSVTAKILHDADCPVWTGVHLEEARDAEKISFRTILAAVDLGPQSERSLVWAAAMAESYKARLIVIHAVHCAEEPDSDRGETGWKARLTAECQGELEKLLEDITQPAEVLIEHGDAPEVVCSAARQMGADLLVIGRGSAAGVFGRLRANAYSIIRTSPCPVVSV